MTRALSAVVIGAALVSPFWFPYPFTLLLSFGAAIAFPPVALLVGLIADLVYFSPPAALPWGIVGGGVMAAAGYIVRRFIKARIIV